jgi:4a-hydroxytetrahydrobiopterin dehydratase
MIENNTKNATRIAQSSIAVLHIYPLFQLRSKIMSRRAVLSLLLDGANHRYSVDSQRRRIKEVLPGFTSRSQRFFATMLSPEEREKATSNLPSWTDISDRNAITKTYKFQDFQQAWAFMSDVAKVADEMNHHPEWSNVYNSVAVTLTTHDCNGVSQKVNSVVGFGMC